MDDNTRSSSKETAPSSCTQEEESMAVESSEKAPARKRHSDSCFENITAPAKVPKLAEASLTKPDELQNDEHKKKKKTDVTVAHVSPSPSLLPVKTKMREGFVKPPKRAKMSSRSILVNDSTEIGEDTSKDSSRKKNRPRTKAVLQSVLDQMEFYFSDYNLSKDRFLRKQYDENTDRYVDLSVFGNFNKLQSLRKDGVSLSILQKAIANSTFLKLNENGTKVKRVTPLKEINQEEVDNRTIYVEHLPSHANHEWIQKIFSECGKVCYISLPTYKSTKQIKRFAFVEFQTSEEAANACQMLNNPLPAKSEEKPGKFPKSNKTLDRLEKKAPPKVDTDSNEENVPEEPIVEEPPEDLKVEVANTGTALTKKKKKKAKKRKMQDADDSPVKKASKISENQEVKKKKKRKRRKPSVSMESSDIKEEEDRSADSKKKDEGVMSEPMEEGVDAEGSKTEDKSKTTDDLASKKKKKKKKKKKRGDKAQALDSDVKNESLTADAAKDSKEVEIQKQSQEVSEVKKKKVPKEPKEDSTKGVKLSQRKERKLQRQMDIRNKKKMREMEAASAEISEEKTQEGKGKEEEKCGDESVSTKQKTVGDECPDNNGASLVRRRSDGSELTSCLVKVKKPVVQKKVEFNPVPITTEFVRRKEIRRRKKSKKDKLHLRVIAKKEWLSLKNEYITRQKSHMTALKESLRDLRMQENGMNDPDEPQGKRHLDLENVFGTKRLKPSQEVKMAHVEELKLIPNVVVQWKSSHEIHRDKIRSFCKQICGESIAYIDSMEEAKSGYIRFKEEDSADKFTRMSRLSASFSARVLPMSQQAAYWEKANKDRMAKLGRKKSERGSEKIARKVFERNKVTFQQKGSRIVFNDEETNQDDPKMDIENGEKSAAEQETTQS